MFDYYGSFLLDPYLILSPPSPQLPHYFSWINNSSKFVLGLISSLHECSFECFLSREIRIGFHIHVKHTDIHHKVDCHGMEVTVFALPRTKCSLLGEDVYWAVQEGISNPDTHLNNHFSVNDPPMNAHLFTYKHPKGIHPLTKQVFIDCLNAPPC